MAERNMMDREMLHSRAQLMAEDVLGRHPATAAKRKALAKSIMACCDHAAAGGD
jgi:hypothetical protein